MAQGPGVSLAQQYLGLPVAHPAGPEEQAGSGGTRLVPSHSSTLTAF